MSCKENNNKPTNDDGTFFILDKSEILNDGQYLNHAKYYGKFVSGYNYHILEAIDKVQSTAMDGGGYFTGISANPTESPIGYNLQFNGYELIDAPRSTSYCSGASYSVFIESLNIISEKYNELKPDSIRLEAIRMQEPDGGRREDHIKYWGKWNANGFGSQFALVQYSGMGKEIFPSEARPGDFVNISWKSGNGHSVVFLSWIKDKDDNKYLHYWSSQKGTNGIGDQLVSIDRIKNIKIVRLISPKKINEFDVFNDKINTKIPGDIINFYK